MNIVHVLPPKLALIITFLLVSFTTYFPFEQQRAYAQTPQASSTTVVMSLGSSAATTVKGYEPDPVTVAAGSTVTWKNEDNALHTATSGNGATATPDGKFDTGYVAAGQSSDPITMPTEPGEYLYL